MTTMRVASDLAAVMVPIGYAGAALATIFAIVAAVAIIRGAGGLAGGAVGLWIVGALMSVAASFGQDWTPLILACGSLVAMLIVGAIVRAIVNVAGDGRVDRTAEDALPKAVPASKAPSAPTSKSAKSALSKTGPATASVAIVR